MMTMLLLKAIVVVVMMAWNEIDVFLLCYNLPCYCLAGSGWPIWVPPPCTQRLSIEMTGWLALIRWAREWLGGWLSRGLRFLFHCLDVIGDDAVQLRPLGIHVSKLCGEGRINVVLDLEARVAQRGRGDEIFDVLANLLCERMLWHLPWDTDCKPSITISSGSRGVCVEVAPS